ncbi:MAG: hypothetical protein ACRDRW_07790 [Pseudonocardiaceae bacterium]
MTAVAVEPATIPRLLRWARAVVLTVHVAMSVGWLGIDGALVALEVTGLSSVHPVVRAGIATSTAVISCWVLVPVVFFSLVSGLVLALFTHWGLTRHWWVLAKFGIAAVLAAAGLVFLVPALPQIFAGRGEPAGMPTLIGRVVALVLLLAATGLSVVKPWGKTPSGRRMQDMPGVGVKFFAIPRLSRRARAVVLTVHVAMSVGWLGIDGALVALEVTGLSSVHPVVRAGIAAATAVIAYWLLVPVVFFSLGSGLILGLSTPWGLVRHWWMLAKCGIAAVLTAAGLVFLVPALPQILAGGGEPAGMPTLIGRGGALVLLLAATGLSVVKPWGKTPHGRKVRTRPLLPAQRTVQQK